MRKKKPNLQNLKTVRVVILGDNGVGKSAMTVRFLTKRFIGEYDSTLEATYQHHVEVNNDFIAVELTDTAGENSSLKLEKCLGLGEVFIVLYSITNRSSFGEAARIGSYIRDRKSSDAMPITLVGTKKDLEHFRQVKESEGSDLAQEMDSTFFELSTSDCDGFRDVSLIIVNSIKRFLKREKREKEKEQKGNNSLSLLKMKESFIKRTPSLRRKSIAAS